MSLYYCSWHLLFYTSLNFFSNVMGEQVLGLVMFIGLILGMFLGMLKGVIFGDFIKEKFIPLKEI